MTNIKKLTLYNTPEYSPGFLLWHVSTKWRSHIESVLKSFSLTHPQFVVMASLGWLTQDGKRVTQADIGKMAGLDPNTISQIIKGLEKKGLITRVVSDDPRAKNPLLTKKGYDILSQALPAVETADNQYFSNLNQKEMNILIKTFQKI